MKRNKLLITGGAGLLGKEILKLDKNILVPNSSELDITKPDTIRIAFEKYKPEVVLHLAAATKPPEHEKNPLLGIETNIIGSANISKICHEYGIKLVYTSSDYVYKGRGPHKEEEAIYAPSRFIWSKIGGEAAVSMLNSFLILRLSFGPVPFPWDKVYKGQWNSKLYVDEIAPLVLGAALSDAEGVMNIGGPRTTLEAYAKRSRSDIETILKPDWAPEDTSLDISKMKKVLGITDERKLLKR